MLGVIGRIVSSIARGIANAVRGAVRGIGRAARGLLSRGRQSLFKGDEKRKTKDIWKALFRNTCEKCAANHNSNCDDVGYPPEHPNCECYVKTVLD